MENPEDDVNPCVGTTTIQSNKCFSPAGKKACAATYASARGDLGNCKQETRPAFYRRCFGFSVTDFPTVELGCGASDDDGVEVKDAAACQTTLCC
jgi:hypothetical protein